MSEHKHIYWWEIFLWIGFVGSIVYIPESGDLVFIRASVAAGSFAIAFLFANLRFGQPNPISHGFTSFTSLLSQSRTT